MGLLSGRDTIGLTGYYGGEKTTVDLDLVDAFDGSYQNSITQHPIEKDASDPDFNMIADHIEPKPANVTVKAILADKIGLLTFESAKDKLKTIIYWQRTGTVVKLEGYETGAGIFGKLFSALSSGVGALFNSDLDEPFYMGTDTDVIENIVLGNMTFERNKDLGTDIRITFSVQRIHVAVAELVSRGQTSTKNVTSSKENPKITKTQDTKKSILMKGSG